jgi:protein TonB
MTSTLPMRDRLPAVPRNVLVAGCVVLLHVAALWAFQTGLLRRVVEVVVPVELLSAISERPRVEPAPPKPAPVEPVQQPVVRKTTPAPPPAPRPVAIPDTTPAPSAPVGITEPQPAPPPIAAPVAAAPAPAAPAPAPSTRVELPATDADYLHNPEPPYPRMSFKLGEEGTTVVRVLVGPDGRAQDAQIGKSSGFARLDQAALETALRSWRYVPGRRGGVAEAMWVNVPIKWEIKQ